MPSLSNLPTFKQIFADRFLLVWNFGAMLTFFAPLLIFIISRAGAENNEEEAQDEENYNYYDNENGGSSHWWQFWKSDYDDDEQGNDQRSGDENQTPWWWLWGGERERDPDEEGQGTLMFVYIWILLLLGAITFYGNYVVATDQFMRRRFALLWAMAGHMNVAFVCCVLLGGLDAVKTEGREIEETGWYGQTSVLVFMTCLFSLVHGIIFLVWIRRRANTMMNNSILHKESESFGYKLDQDQHSRSGLQSETQTPNHAVENGQVA